MGPADTLSRKDEVETGNDNWEITLLKGKDQYFHICAINATLTNKISSSSTMDPVVTKALATMNSNTVNHGFPEPPKQIGNSLTTPCTLNIASMFLNWPTMT